eukprot:1161929-Pelagomonas_calceolata.AAC.6
MENFRHGSVHACIKGSVSYNQAKHCSHFSVSKASLRCNWNSETRCVCACFAGCGRVHCRLSPFKFIQFSKWWLAPASTMPPSISKHSACIYLLDKCGAGCRGGRLPTEGGMICLAGEGGTALLSSASEFNINCYK